MIKIIFGVLLFCGVIFSTNAQEVEVPAEQPVDEVSETQDTNLEETVSEQPQQEEPVEEVVYVDVEVFSPSFMKSLIGCKPDSESNQENTIEIIGIKDQRCQIKYANFDLNVPPSLMGNIQRYDSNDPDVENDYEFSISFLLKAKIKWRTRLPLLSLFHLAV